MSSQEARRAQLKAEIRREIDANSRLLVHTKSSLPKTGTPASKVVVAATPNHFKEYTEGNDHVPTSSPARRSELFVKNFHSTQAINCIRQTSTRVESSPARVNSPRRRASSPQLNPSVDANSAPISPAALPAAPPASAERSFAFSTSSESELRFSRAGLVHRSSFDHHKNIVFPDPSGQNEHSKLWLSKPLADGSRHAQTKRMFHDVQRDSTPKRSESPGGKRRITAPDHLSGSAATVTPDAPPVPVTGRRHVPESSSRTDSPSRAPYFESALERPSSTGRNHGLLGYGPTGKSFANRPVDHPRLLDEDNGKVGGEAVQRGVRPVAGKSFTSINVTTLHEYPAELVHEEKFKPSVVVLHGPPAFVPPPLPQRTQSPRRGTPRASDNDIFNTAPQSVNASAPAPPLRVGRGVGVYSPARSERPW